MSSSQMILSTARSLGNLKISIVSEERKLLLFSWTINCFSLPILSNKKLSPASPPEDHVSKARSTAWEVMETSQSRARFCMFQLLEEHSLRELWDLTLPPASCLGLPCVLLWHTDSPQAESNCEPEWTLSSHKLIITGIGDNDGSLTNILCWHITRHIIISGVMIMK